MLEALVLEDLSCGSIRPASSIYPLLGIGRIILLCESVFLSVRLEIYAFFFLTVILRWTHSIKQISFK